MQRTSYYSASSNRVKRLLLLLICLLPAAATAGGHIGAGEVMAGFYAREGNNASPAKTSGNNIYIKFFDDRWVGMMFIPYPYAIEVDDKVVDKVFLAARKQAASAAFLKGKYGLLSQAATVQVERYGYLEDRIIFECGALSPCSIRPGDGSLELIKPGVINEHIIKFNHVSAP